jgi:ubiquinone/menaquinone biosynthesis C-methylase UbiE
VIRPTRNMNAEFEERYRVSNEAVMRRIESRVIGADYGATSYTTIAQAERLLEVLELNSGTRLLDVGSGAGWPGVYLARRSGCRVVLTDRALFGLRAAVKRMAEEHVCGQVVAASGSPLPFRDSVFDAVTSSDVLC